MKQEFLISRLDEPNIAYLYVMEVDQNLLNNIRVLCTRQPETLRYFVPQELFWKIRNGEPVAFTAECFDVYGRKLFTVDPLKVLSEQFMDRRIVPGLCGTARHPLKMQGRMAAREKAAVRKRTAARERAAPKEEAPIVPVQAQAHQRAAPGQGRNAGRKTPLSAAGRNRRSREFFWLL